MISALSQAFAFLRRKERALRHGALTDRERSTPEAISIDDVPGLHRLFPDNPTYVSSLALAVAQRGETGHALALLDDVEAKVGRTEDTSVARAEVLLRRGQRNDAIVVLAELGFESQNPSTHMLLGENHYRTGRFAEADRSYARAIELNPRSAPALLSRAAAAARLGRLDEAERFALGAVRFDPRSRDAHGNLHWAYGLGNRLEAEEMAVNAGLEFFPGDADLVVARGILRLLRGDFELGWADFDARLTDPSKYPIRRSLLERPRWNGQSFAGKTLLVFGEQGAGDSIMMARYLPEVKARGGRVVLEAPENLHELLQSAGGVDDFVSLALEREPDTPFDYWVPVMSFGRLFGARPGRIPNRTPYLCVPEETRQFWRGAVGTGSGARVGVAWAGNPKHVNDHFRSVPAAAIAPALNTAGISFYSLQVDRREAPAVPIRDLTEHIITFMDTAALVEQMDLVIAVDTSVAHLSAALGRLTWVLLPYRPDWRWLLDRDDSPWYPTVRLFRQPKPLDWDSVVSNVVDALVEWRDRRSAPDYRTRGLA